MDMMLADLAFAARPPPVMTPEEGGAPEEVRRPHRKRQPEEPRPALAQRSEAQDGCCL